MALLVIAAAIGPPAVVAAAAVPRLVASGGLLGAQLSANGEWLLFDRAVTTGRGAYNSRLFLWRRGRVRPVGRGIAQGAVSNDGQTIAYQCAEYVLCIKRTGRPVRRLSIRCRFSPPVLAVAGNLKSFIFECSGGAGPTATAHTLVRIGATRATTQRLPGRSLVLRGLSTDGTTAVFERSNRSVEVYRRGHLKVVPGVFSLGGVSRNGRYVVGTSAQRVNQTCPYEDPTKELGFEAGQPVIADLQSGRQRRVPASYLCLGQAVAVSDDGRFLIYSSRRLSCPPCAALVVVNVSTGQTKTLATDPGLEYGGVQLGSDGTATWVRGRLPQAIFVSRYVASLGRPQRLKGHPAYSHYAVQREKRLMKECPYSVAVNHGAPGGDKSSGPNMRAWITTDPATHTIDFHYRLFNHVEFCGAWAGYNSGRQDFPSPTSQTRTTGDIVANSYGPNGLVAVTFLAKPGR